jgi:hypothetical protein
VQRPSGEGRARSGHRCSAGQQTACPVVAPGRSNVVRVDAVHAAQKGAVRSGPTLDRSAPDVEMAGTDAFRTAAIDGLVATVVDLFVAATEVGRRPHARGRRRYCFSATCRSPSATRSDRRCRTSCGKQTDSRSARSSRPWPP